MRAVWVVEAYCSVFLERVAFPVEFSADVTVVGALPVQQRVEEFVVAHALFEEACHFAFAGYAKVYAFSVVYACGFHVCDEAGAFSGYVYADFLEAVPAVLERFDVAKYVCVFCGLAEYLEVSEPKGVVLSLENREDCVVSDLREV